MADDKSFDYEYGDDSFDTDDFDLDITDIDQLYDFYDDLDLVEYEYHGTGDTGGTS